MAVDPEKLLWSTPLPLSDRGREYFYKLKKLPKEGVERLVFFQDFLEDKEDMLARDAYDEFAKAPFDVVKELKPQMRKAVLWAWINDLEGVPASRRRLYLTMLSVCGDEKDLEPLETMLTAADKKQRSGLDALVACYLTLKGDAGLPFIETLFLSNKKADYAETYSTIMALRFHATESDVLSKPRIVQSLRFMLERPELADLVIPDLARLEDWDAAPRLMELYRTADEKSSWVRVPIINFLRAGPDKAKMEPLLKECEKIDPDSVKRANTLFPFGAATKTSQATPADEEEQKSAVRRVAATEPVDEPVATIATANTNKSNGKRETAANIGATRAVAALKEPRSAPGRAREAQP
jgi:hypothetical protein